MKVKFFHYVLLFTVVALFMVLPAGAYPVSFVDDAGREIVLEEEPQRIVSLASSVTEKLFALGLGERVVGVTTECNYPEEALEKPKMGDVQIDVEAIVAADPHLIFTMSGMDEPIQQLRDLGFTVVVVEPATLDDILVWIQRIGDLTGVSEEAEAMIQYMEERMGAIRAKAQEKEESPQVFVEVWNDPIMTIGPGTFIQDIIEMAGGTNMGEDLPQAWATISFEQLLAENPDVIVVVWDTPERVYERQGWEGIAALEKEQVYYIHPDFLFRPGPRIVEGLEQLFDILY